MCMPYICNGGSVVFRKYQNRSKNQDATALCDSPSYACTEDTKDRLLMVRYPVLAPASSQGRLGWRKNPTSRRNFFTHLPSSTADGHRQQSPPGKAHAVDGSGGPPSWTSSLRGSSSVSVVGSVNSMVSWSEPWWCRRCQLGGRWIRGRWCQIR